MSVRWLDLAPREMLGGGGSVPSADLQHCHHKHVHTSDFTAGLRRSSPLPEF